MRHASDGAAFCAAPDRGSDQRRYGTQDVNDPVSGPATRRGRGEGSFTSWVPRVVLIARIRGGFTVESTATRDAADRIGRACFGPSKTTGLERMLTRGWRFDKRLRFGRRSARVNTAKRRAEAREALTRALHGRTMTIRSARTT